MNGTYGTINYRMPNLYIYIYTYISVCVCVSVISSLSLSVALSAFEWASWLQQSEPCDEADLAADRWPRACVEVGWSFPSG